MNPDDKSIMFYTSPLPTHFLSVKSAPYSRNLLHLCCLLVLIGQKGRNPPFPVPLPINPVFELNS